MRYCIPILLFICCVTMLSAQAVSNIRIKQDAELGYYTVTFDLSGKADDTYVIEAIPFKSGKEISNPRYLSGKGMSRTCSAGKDIVIFWNPAMEGVNTEGWQFRINANPNSKNFVLVEGGTFNMGSKDGRSNEKPVHQVTISSFYISKCEVTLKEWVEVMHSNPSKFKGDNLPVERVSWYKAVDYCNKRSIKEALSPCYSISGENITCDWTANGYRLPTEAEWEYAARGGNNTNNSIYSGSNGIDAIGWYGSNSERNTHAVGSRIANELGLFDMNGNVWEWCWDFYGSYPRSLQNNPIGSNSGTYRVVRGGSWRNDAAYCTVSYRNGDLATNGTSSLGFRLCKVSP